MNAVGLLTGCQDSPFAEVTATGCGAAPDPASPTAIQPSGPCATLLSSPDPCNAGTAPVGTSCQLPLEQRQIAG